MSQRPAASLVWMREEDDQLRAAAVSGESIAAISKRLCRSEKAIWHRARKIGIELPQYEREAAAKGEGKMTETGRVAARPWTPADDEVLRSLALKGVDARGIGNRLNRTADAVRSRAKRLNILIRKHRGSAEEKKLWGGARPGPPRMMIGCGLLQHLERTLQRSLCD